MNQTTNVLGFYSPIALNAHFTLGYKAKAVASCASVGLPVETLEGYRSVEIYRSGTNWSASVHLSLTFLLHNHSSPIQTTKMHSYEAKGFEYVVFMNLLRALGMRLLFCT